MKKDTPAPVDEMLMMEKDFRVIISHDTNGGDGFWGSGKLTPGFK